MGTKHFSHNHTLVFHQVPQGSQIHCSGCKSPGSGYIYACWQCSYFLHEQCFRASRSFKHPSHPLHPLTLVPSPTYPSGSFFCNTCNLGGDGFSYSCSECEFDIHLHCALPHPHVSPSSTNLSFPKYPFVTPAYQPNQPPLGYPQSNKTQQTFVPPANAITTALPAPPPSATIIKHFSHPHALKLAETDQNYGKLCSACESGLSGSTTYCCTEPHCRFNLHKACFDSPRELRHKSHLQHPLTLLTAPPNSDGSFTCDACQKSGKAFSYTCTTCSYDLHINCVRWSETVTRPDHKHPLNLRFSSPVAGEGMVFMCDVCKDPADEMGWLYYCRQCDFGTHLECVHADVKHQNVGAGKTQQLLISDALHLKIMADTHQAMLDLWD